MLSLYIENFISFCVIMLLFWFDFHRNIPCLCYSIRNSPRDTTTEIVPKLTWNILLPWIHLTYRCTDALKLYIIFTDFDRSRNQQKFISSVLWISMWACVGLLVEKALFFQDLVLTLFLFLNFCFSRFVSLGL